MDHEINKFSTEFLSHRAAESATIMVVNTFAAGDRMRVLLLGTTGYHPTNRRHTACILLPDLGICFDAGTGMFRTGKYLTAKTLDIFLSHAHLDHIVGLTFFFSLLAERPGVSIRVHGDPVKLAAIRELLFSAHFFPVEPPFEWHAIQPHTTLPCGGTLESFPLNHPGGSLGYRLDCNGRSLAYVTDTTAAANAPYIDHIRGVDLLLHECNFPNGQAELAGKTGHSCLDEVAQVAAAAAVKRLVLIHFDPLMEVPAEQLAAAKRIYPHITAGEDEMEICV